MKSVMIYGHDRCGTTTLMHCLAKNRVILGEFLTEDYADQHAVKSMVTMSMSTKEFKISNTAALSAIMQSNSVIAKCHLHWVKPEHFDFNGIKIMIHRQDIVESQLSKQLAIQTRIWNSSSVPTILTVPLSVEEFVKGVEDRLNTQYINQPMDYVMDYDIHLPMLIEQSGYNLLHNSNKKLYNDKRNWILNYDQLMQKAEQYEDDIDALNASIKYTGLDSNLEYDKWIASDNVDFYH